MSELVKTIETIETLDKLQASEEAKAILNCLLKRKQELEDMHAIIQPLLYSISLALYGENDEEVALSKLVFDACAFINGRTEETLQ